MMPGDIDRVREALHFVPASDRDTWVQMGMAVKSEVGEAGFDLWESWSQQDESFDPKAARDVWKSLRSAGKVTAGTLFHEAKAHGWRDDGTHQKLTPEELADRRRIAAKRSAQEDAETERERAEAATKAAAIWKAGVPATVDNPYLSRKHVSPAPTLREIDTDAAAANLGYAPKSGGVALAGRLLVVPVKQGDGLSTLELIDGEGRKAALAGRGTKAGGYWASEQLPKGDGDGLTLLIGEGVATVLSGKEASGHPAVAALSAGNLPAVAKAMRERYPIAALVILADLVKATGALNPHAIETARSVGGLLAIPAFGTDRPEKATDFNDMAALHGLKAVKQAIAGAQKVGAADTVTGESDASRIVVVSLMDFVTRDIPPRERILAPWLLTQSLNMVYAWRGIGKTHVALGIAYATASGGSFLKWKAVTPRRVLYIDGEMPAASMQERLKGLIASNDDDFDPDYFRLVTPDLQTGGMPDLATAEGQDAIEAVMGNTELIVIDNLSCLARSGGRENDAESWLPIQPWALKQRQQGRSVLFLHHSGKGGAQRGTSKKEDILDTVLTLKRPADYNPADGAVFEVHFEKTRDMHGNDADPFEARLQTDSRGQSAWTYSSVEDSTFDRVVTLANDGLTQKDIAAELDINKSNVSRHFRRAIGAGLIQKGTGHAGL